MRALAAPQLRCRAVLFRLVIPACLLLFAWVASSCSLAETTSELPLWLIKNNWKHLKGLPKNFRKMHDPRDDYVTRMMSKSMRRGLDTLNASGSAQFSRENLEALVEAVGPFKLTVVDLRQEPHGFVNKNLPVSWYQGQDQLNWGKSLAEIEQDESKRLEDLVRTGTAMVFELVRPANDPSALKAGADPERIEIKSACNESTLCRSEHLNYVRMPVADYHHPADDCVDRFVKLARSLGPEEWLHLHAGADDGRTATFLAMFDMMQNAGRTGIVDIIERQQMLGGIDLLQTAGNHDRKIAYMEDRANFIREFYRYCAEQIPHKFSTPWSKWKKLN